MHLFCANDCNLLGENINTTYTLTTRTLRDANGEVGLETSAEQAKRVLTSHHQNTGQDRNINITEKILEKVTHCKIWERQ